MKRLVLFDKDEKYITAFADYLVRGKVLPYQIIVFTDFESFSSYLVNSDSVSLLISEDVGREIHLSEYSNIEKVVCLLEKNTDVNMMILDKCNGGIYKYMSMEKIAIELRELFVDDGMIIGCDSGELVGIFNPFAVKGRIDFGIALGQVLSEKGKTIYFNLEEFSGLSEYMEMDFQFDLTDLMYEFIQQEKGNYIKAKGDVYKCGELDYIPPPSYSEDLHKMKTSNWISLIKGFVAKRKYKYTILEFGGNLNEPLYMLHECKVIYMIVPDDQDNMRRIRELIKYLSCCEMEEVLECVVPIKLPEYEMGSINPSELSIGSLGEYIRGELMDIYD